MRPVCKCRQDSTLPCPQLTGLCSAVLFPWGTPEISMNCVSDPNSLYMSAQVSFLAPVTFSDLAEKLWRCNSGMQTPAMTPSHQEPFPGQYFAEYGFSYGLLRKERV